MPRKRQRFSKLKAFLKASNGLPPAGSEAEKYLKFISGQTKLTMANAQKGGARERALVSLKAFNKAPTRRYGAFITRYCYKQQGNVGLPQSATGQDKYNTANTPPDTYDGAYNPAIIIWRSNAVDDKKIDPQASKVSNITGKTYASAGGRSGVVPFGRVADTDLEDDNAKTLQSAVKSTPGGLGATYQPEEWNAPFVPRDAKAAFGG